MAFGFCIFDLIPRARGTIRDELKILGIDPMEKSTHSLVIFLGLIFITLFFGEPSQGGLFKSNPLEVIEVMGYGEVNWTRLTIRAKGNGIPNPQVSKLSQAPLGADREAKKEALENLLKTIKAVPIDSQITFQQKVEKSDVISSKLQELIRNAEIIETTYFSDGGVKIIVKLPLFGPLINLILPTSERRAAVKADEDVNTGVIIDSRGLKTTPILAPKILDEEGKEVYSSSFISSESLGKWGVVEYLRDLPLSQKEKRVGKNPLIVKGIGLAGPRSSDIIISNADAQKIRGLIKDHNFLSNGEAIVVID